MDANITVTKRVASFDIGYHNLALCILVMLSNGQVDIEKWQIFDIGKEYGVKDTFDSLTQEKVIELTKSFALQKMIPLLQQCQSINKCVIEEQPILSKNLNALAVTFFSTLKDNKPSNIETVSLQTPEERLRFDYESIPTNVFPDKFVELYNASIRRMFKQ